MSSCIIERVGNRIIISTVGVTVVPSVGTDIEWILLNYSGSGGGGGGTLGGGGGSGEYFKNVLVQIMKNTPITVTIGEVGIGGESFFSGTDGEPTTIEFTDPFSSFITLTASGGKGGVSVSETFSIPPDGGDGGTGNGGSSCGGGGGSLPSTVPFLSPLAGQGGTGFPDTCSGQDGVVDSLGGDGGDGGKGGFIVEVSPEHTKNVYGTGGGGGIGGGNGGVGIIKNNSDSILDFVFIPAQKGLSGTGSGGGGAGVNSPEPVIGRGGNGGSGYVEIIPVRCRCFN